MGHFARHKSQVIGTRYKGAVQHKADDVTASPDNTFRKRFLAGYPFELDAFQLGAMDALDEGHSVVVAAPTGAGKTVVAEYAVARALAAGAKAFYTTPLKALSNQKFADFTRIYGSGRVGLLTGDNAINGDAPVVVMTTEVLRNMIYAGSSSLNGLRYVVLDEVHYLQDPYRGPVWEEVIIHLPPEVDLVCLSATVSNAEELADWVETVRGSTRAVIEERRPVPLHNLFLVGERRSEELLLLPTFVDGHPNPRGMALTARVDDGWRAYRRSGLFAPRRAETVELLAATGLLPAIYFIFSRAGCDEAVRQCMREGRRLTSASERRQIREMAEATAGRLSDDDLAALGYGEWLAGLEAGFAAHHAGLVPPFKEAVERCFFAGLVKVVFATETLSLGINMPARSVVIEKLSKFGGERVEPLTPGEYTQLTGRAGRRGTRRGRLRRRDVVAGDHLRPGRLRWPAPAATPSRRASGRRTTWPRTSSGGARPPRPTTCSTSLSRSTGLTPTSSAWRATSTAPARSWPLRWPNRSANSGMSSSTGGSSAAAPSRAGQAGQAERHRCRHGGLAPRRRPGGTGAQARRGEDGRQGGRPFHTATGKKATSACGP